jgi:hypothetical protein
MERFRKLAGTPSSDGLNTCPTIIGQTDDDKIIVQGLRLDDETRCALNIPDGEDAVAVPRDLYLRGAAALTED